VGQNAYNQLKATPELVIRSIKRLIGRGFSDRVVKDNLSKFSYKITQSSQGTENSLSVWLEDKEYIPEQISAAILKKVIDNAQTYQNQTGQTAQISAAVITIPAYFNDKQRYATQKAGTLAGLTTVQLLAEPTAAAISYGFKPDSDEVKTILVYDFGGGTFDSSIITTAGNQFIESGKAGDLWLGGDDLDDLMIELIKQKVAQTEEIADIDDLINKLPHYQKIRFLADLKIAAEKAKIELSSNEIAHVIPATPLLDALGMAIDIDVTITRKELETIFYPLVQRSISICIQGIKDSEYPEEMIDIILLVGGSSQIPLVQQEVKKAFGADKVVVHPRPMYAVAEGAAIEAAGLTQRVSTVSRNYFIQLADNPRYPLIKRGELLPVTKLENFRTSAAAQSLIHFKFFSPDEVAEAMDGERKDEGIGDMWLALDTEYPKGTEILVTTELNEQDNTLQITAVLKNNPAIRVSANFSRGEKDEQISTEVETLIDEFNESKKLTEYGAKKVTNLAREIIVASNQIRDYQGNIQSDRQKVAETSLKELRNLASEDLRLANFFLSDFECVRENCQMLLEDSQISRIKVLVSQLKSALQINNLSGIQKLVEDSNTEKENLPDVVWLILICNDCIARAFYLNPTHAHALTVKFQQMLSALEQGNTHGANILLAE
jgi:molecular chaperone DnaK